MARSAFREMLHIVGEEYPALAAQWEESRSAFGDEWEREISENIARVFGDAPGTRWTEAVDGYAEFTTEALRAHVAFEKTGRYPASSYEECVRDCYTNRDYMALRYLPGQYLSHYIWPQHHRMFDRFRREVLPAVGNPARFYEVGVGCGLYTQAVLQAFPEARGTAVDISPFALDFTLRVARAHGVGDRLAILRQDILASSPPPEADLTISQEVLEHLEDPLRFLRALRRMTRPGGFGYLSAAINAAHTDHIYRYARPEEMFEHVERAGWRILDTQTESNPKGGRKYIPTIAGAFAENPAEASGEAAG